MKLTIYRGTINVDAAKAPQVGVEDTEHPNDNSVLCLCGPAGDEESEELARRIKAMFEFCETFTTKALEDANKLRADWRVKTTEGEKHAPV